MIDEKQRDLINRSPDSRVAAIKLVSERYFKENPEYLRNLKPARLDSTGTSIIMGDRLRSNELPKAQEGDNDPVNLADYFSEHVNDASVKRHIYLSGTSGSGKSTCLYDIWEKYLDDNNKYVPIYIPLFNVNGSLKTYIVNRYLEPAGINDFCWLHKHIEESSYHIVMLLDGYNESMDDNTDQIDSEIDDILCMEGVTAIISSRDSRIDLSQNITRLKLCPLTSAQVFSLLGGNKAVLSNYSYDEVLTNPFMLEKSIRYDAGDVLEKKPNISQVPIEIILHNYIQKQIRGNGFLLLNQIYISVILPLVAMKLDRRKMNEKILQDSKVFRWEIFSKTVRSIQKSINTYGNSIGYYIGDRPGYDEYIDDIKNDPNLAIELVSLGTKLELFSRWDLRGGVIIWDHEIYRNYFTARGYALYASAHKDSENCIYNLARQVNCRYPEPKDGINYAIRASHVQKAQMFIDMVDAGLSDHIEFNEENITKLKKTATYRRLVRDVALIYYDMNDKKTLAATDLCLKYYSDDLKKYDKNSKYDYKSIMRRYADAAFTLSALAYNYMHVSYAGISRDEVKMYLNRAGDVLKLSESVFYKLNPEIKKIPTVRDDLLKFNGNCAAYNIAMFRIERHEEYINRAIKLHKDNVVLRKEIKKDLERKGSSYIELDFITKGIATSYAGIATCYYYLRDFDEAIKNYSIVIDLRKNISEYSNALIIFNPYRSIIGCFSEKDKYTPNDCRHAIEWIAKALNYANSNNILQRFEILSDEIEKILNKIPVSLKHEEIYSKYEKEIESLMIEILGQSDGSKTSIRGPLA